MKKIFLLFPILILGYLFAACSDEEQDMRIELASPKPQVKTELAKAIFSWAEIDKAAGYAYALDDSQDYTFLESSVAEVTLSGLSRGTHTFKIYSVGEDGKSFDSQLRELSFEINPAITAPIVSYVAGDNPGEIIVSWTKQKDAVGYAYKVKDASTWNEVDASTLSVTLTGVRFEETFPFTIKSIGNPPLSEDSEEYTEIIDMTRSVGVWAVYTRQGIEPIQLQETGTNTGIYNATISCLGTDAFYVNIDNTKYGFMSYSGNGGIGTVNNDFAAVPYYNNNGGGYYVRESIGLMQAGGNNFYTNVNANCKVFVQVDTGGERPSYYLQLVKDNPSDGIVLAQYFDLMAYGGDWSTYIKGTSYLNGSTINVGDTGLSEGVKNGAASGTVFGSHLIETDFAPEFIKNKGLDGWTFERIFEFPGFIRLSNSGADLHGLLITPQLNYAGNVVVTFDGMKFASLKLEDIYIEVEVINGGKITSSKVRKDGEGQDISIAPATETTFRINGKYNTDYANNENKKWSNYTFTIENITPQTQIKWNCKTNTSVRSENYRYCIDNIVVKKQ